MPSDDSKARHGELTSKRRIAASEISSLVAVLISFFALALGLYQTHVMQGQARASVWPVLEIGYDYSDAGEHRGFIWRVSNHGVGPAKIKSVIVRVDGLVEPTWDAVLQRVLGKPRSQMQDAEFNRLAGVVLPADSNRETAIEPIKLTAADGAEAFENAVTRLDMEICYCSVYEDCWIARWRKTDVVATDRCDVDADRQFRN